MPAPRFEVPTGLVDGVNTIFVVSIPYQPKSTAVFLNGQLQSADLAAGWTETSPTTGVVTLNEAPRLLDVVQIFFIDTAARAPEEEVSPISGKITVSEDLAGSLIEEVPLFGKITGL